MGQLASNEMSTWRIGASLDETRVKAARQLGDAAAGTTCACLSPACDFAEANQMKILQIFFSILKTKLLVSVPATFPLSSVISAP